MNDCDKTKVGYETNMEKLIYGTRLYVHSGQNYVTGSVLKVNFSGRHGVSSVGSGACWS